MKGLDMTEYNWVHGDNGSQEYYEAETPDGVIDICRTHPHPYWMAHTPNGLVYSKKAHDKQRRKQHLPNDADWMMLRVHTPLQLTDASIMKKRAIQAYETGIREL